MITASPDRMLELLWFVAYCGWLPTQMAKRIGGHPDWNRHVMYRAVREGYTEIGRWECRQRIYRLLRVTESGLAYIAKRDPENAALLYAMQDGERIHMSPEKAARAYAVATGVIMAHNAGAVIHPGMKPDLRAGSGGPRTDPDPGRSYYYTVGELRDAVEQWDPRYASKSSRIVGVIVRGGRCYCLYYTGNRRMYWRAPTECNMAASVYTLLCARGFRCDTVTQVVIGTSMNVAERVVRAGINVRSVYLTLNSFFNNCYFVLNSPEGEALLRLITSRELSEAFARRILSGGYRPPERRSRSCDAVTADGKRPVSLQYQCDLLALASLDPAPEGFRESPLILCLDYQADVFQKILGGMCEIRTIREEFPA